MNRIANSDFVCPYRLPLCQMTTRTIKPNSQFFIEVVNFSIFKDLQHGALSPFLVSFISSFTFVGTVSEIHARKETYKEQDDVRMMCVLNVSVSKILREQRRSML